MFLGPYELSQSPCEAIVLRRLSEMGNDEEPEGQGGPLKNVSAVVPLGDCVVAACLPKWNNY